MTRIRIALMLMSAIFFAGLSQVIGRLDTSSSVIFAIYFSIISFVGSMLFLLEAKKILPRWYLAVPLSISIFLLFIIFLCFFYKVNSSNGIFIDLGLLFRVIMALLAPFSVLVFLSLNRHPDSMKAYLAVSSLVSIFSLFSIAINLWGLYILVTSHSQFFPPFLTFYVFFGMPIIGICFLVKTITYKNPEKVLNSITVGSTQN